MLRHKYSDVGVAVAIEGGLFTPVIRHAEMKSLSEISNEMRDLAERARKRRLAPHEYQGGTTSISNLGMYGIKSFDAVINPPHATILAVGAGETTAGRRPARRSRRHCDECDAVLRPPGGRWRHRRRACSAPSSADRGPRAHAGLTAILPNQPAFAAHVRGRVRPKDPTCGPRGTASLISPIKRLPKAPEGIRIGHLLAAGPGRPRSGKHSVGVPATDLALGVNPNDGALKPIYAAALACILGGCSQRRHFSPASTPARSIRAVGGSPKSQEALCLTLASQIEALKHRRRPRQGVEGGGQEIQAQGRGSDEGRRAQQGQHRIPGQVLELSAARRRDGADRARDQAGSDGGRGQGAPKAAAAKVKPRFRRRSRSPPRWPRRRRRRRPRAARLPSAPRVSVSVRLVLNFQAPAVS